MCHMEMYHNPILRFHCCIFWVPFRFLNCLCWSLYTKKEEAESEKEADLEQARKEDEL